MRWSALDVLREQYTHVPRLEPVDLSGRTAIVTGASPQGLGFECAKRLGDLGCRVVIACRNLHTGSVALQDLRRTVPDGKFDLWELDLASFVSIRMFAKRALDELDRLDVLLLNAGVALAEFQLTDDGFERVIQTNSIGPTYLALLLRPLLYNAAEKAINGVIVRPHVTFTGSDAHYWAKFREQHAEDCLEAFNDASYFHTDDRYYTSKLVAMLFCQSLSETFGEKVIVNVASPGFTKTNLFRQAPRLLQPLMWLLQIILARATSVAATVILYAALRPTSQNAYIMSCKECEPSDFLLSRESEHIQKKLWLELNKVIREIKDDATASSMGV